MTRALWYGTPVEVVRRVDDFWTVVKFLETCAHHNRGETVCLNHSSLTVRTPIKIERRAPCQSLR